MTEGTRMKDTRAPLAERGPACNAPKDVPLPLQPSPTRTHFVSPGAVLRAAAARRATAEYLRRSSPQINPD
jgi:hypothetical protein